MRPAPPALLAILVVALASASCALSSEPDTPAEAWTRAYLDARCRYAMLCDAELGQLAAREQVVCHPAGWPSELLDRAARVGSTFGFDEARAMRCLAAIDDAPCGVPWGAPADPDLLGCEDVLFGTVPEGGACDPAIGGRCAPDLPCPGECADRGTCSASDGTCGGVCRAAAQRGERCDVALCSDGLECRLELEGARCRAVELAPGAACDEGETCRAIDGRPHACLEGRCEPVPIVAAGDACGAGVGLCAEGAACLLDVCVTRGGEGAACRYRAECLDGLACDGDRCVANEPGGCWTDRDCPAEAPHCVIEEGETPRLRCSADPTGWPCRTSAYFLDPDGPFALRAEDSCPETHRCRGTVPDGLFLHPTCVPIVAEGDACDERHACPDGTRCSGDRCERIILAGRDEACGGSVRCPEYHACIGGRCVPHATLGEACGRCFEGRCADGRCQLQSTGERCLSRLEGVVPECHGHCRDGACEDTRAEVAAPCGLSAGACAHALECVAQPDGAGACRACSE